MIASPRRVALVNVAVIASLAISSCGDERSTGRSQHQGPGESRHELKEPTPKPGTKASGAPAVASGEAEPAEPASRPDPESKVATSIAECDDYLAKYEACLHKGVPAEHLEGMRGAFRAQRDAWRQSAQAAQGNAQVALQLAMNCKEALAAARAPMQRLGCDW